MFCNNINFVTGTLLYPWREQMSGLVGQADWTLFFPTPLPHHHTQPLPPPPTPFATTPVLPTHPTTTLPIPTIYTPHTCHPTLTTFPLTHYLPTAPPALTPTPTTRDTLPHTASLTAAWACARLSRSTACSSLCIVCLLHTGNWDFLSDVAALRLVILLAWLMLLGEPWWRVWVNMWKTLRFEPLLGEQQNNVLVLVEGEHLPLFLSVAWFRCLPTTYPTPYHHLPHLVNDMAPLVERHDRRFLNLFFTGCGFELRLGNGWLLWLQLVR